MYPPLCWIDYCLDLGCEIRVDWISSSVRSPSGIAYRPVPLQHYIYVLHCSWNQQRHKLQFADALTVFIEWFVVLRTVISYNKILSPLIPGATWTQYSTDECQKPNMGLFTRKTKWIDFEYPLCILNWQNLEICFEIILSFGYFLLITSKLYKCGRVQTFILSL